MKWQYSQVVPTVSSLWLRSTACAVFIYLCLFCTAIDAVASVHAQATLPHHDVIALSEEHSEKPIDSHVRYFADKTGDYKVDGIYAAEHQFIPLAEKKLSLRTDTHWYWIKIFNPKEIEATWYITTGISTPPLLHGYWQSETHSAIETEIPYDQFIPGQTAFQYPLQVLPITLQPKEVGNLVIQYKSIANFPLEIRPYTPEHLMDRAQRLLFFNGIYMGAVCVFFLFFATQFFIRPNRVHLYYSLFVLSTILIMVQVSGFPNFFSEESSARNYNSSLTALIGGSIYLWYFLFSAEFLELKKSSKRLDKTLRGLSLAVFVLTILGLFLPLDYALSLVIVFGLPWPIIAAIWAARQQHPSAKFFLIGSTTHCFTTYLLLFACLGIETRGNEYFFGLASMGLIFDICCFAVAILYQNNQLRIRYNRQLQERINDLNSLAESEQISAKALSMSKQAVLNTAATAHDLQQPLSSMQIMLSLQDPKDPIVKQTKDALDYARALLHSALHSSKENYQNLQESISAKTLLTEAIQRHRNAFSNKGVTVRCRCQDVEVLCLPLVVHRMLDNLLSNANKYTDEGEVLLSGRARKNGTFLIQIWDTGKGMNHAQVKKIMTPFEQLNQNSSDSLGFGLGLYIVKSLCNQAGYDFFVRSKEGHGSCFSIVIPNAINVDTIQA